MDQHTDNDASKAASDPFVSLGRAVDLTGHMGSGQMEDGGKIHGYTRKD